MAAMPSVHIVFASTSGHTEHVVNQIASLLPSLVAGLTVTVRRAEEASAEDLAKGDVLLLACGSWNTGGIEGPLHPYMHVYLKETVKDADLRGRSVAVVGLGDSRYRYTARAKEYLEEFVTSHGGTLLGEGLRVVNEPYGQEEAVKAWAQSLAEKIRSLPLA